MIETQAAFPRNGSKRETETGSKCTTGFAPAIPSPSRPGAARRTRNDKVRTPLLGAVGLSSRGAKRRCDLGFVVMARKQVKIATFRLRRTSQ